VYFQAPVEIENGLSIFVQGLGSKTTLVHLPSQATCNELKRKIHVFDGIMVANGKVLYDNCTLNNHKVVQVFGRLRGGMEVGDF
jgi:hypothetical protein